MTETSLRLQVAVKKSFAWYWVIMAIVMLISLASFIPAVMIGGGIGGAEASARYMEFMNRLKDWPGTSFVFGGFVVINVLLLNWYLRAKRTWLIADGDTLTIGKETFSVSWQDWSPGKLATPYTGTIGTVVALQDSQGEARLLGLKSVLLAEDQYSGADSEQCDFYVEQQESGKALLDWLNRTGVSLGATRDETVDREGPLSFTLIRSMSGFKTWWKFYLGFFVGVYALSGTGYVLFRFLKVSQQVVYIFTLVGAMALIGFSVYWGNKRYKSQSLKLTVDGDRIVIADEKSSKPVYELYRAELNFERESCSFYAKGVGTNYVGPVLAVKKGKKRLFRLGTGDPDTRWNDPVRNVSTSTYVLGPPEWLLVVKKLGLEEGLA
jgi:hypothetical protein